MNKAVKAGLSFGLTSGVITTLGLMVGLHSGSHSSVTVIGGIVTIAIADSFSDALGIHVSKESEGISQRDVWVATVATLLAKMCIAVTFILPVLLFDLSTSILIAIFWGLFILAITSYTLGKSQCKPVLPIIAEHLFIAIIVVVITHYAGEMIGQIFNSI